MVMSVWFLQSVVIVFLYSGYEKMNFVSAFQNTSERSISNSREEPDFIIRLGGLFAVHHRGENETCDKTNFYTRSVEWLEMILYTINGINENPNLLPGVKLVVDPADDCRVLSRAFNQIIHGFVDNRCDNRTGRNNTHWGVIGPLTSELAVPTASLLQHYRMPQISFGATSPHLSDKSQYPYFFRTVPSDAHQIGVIIQLLLEHQWTYVSFVYQDDNYGIAAIDEFEKQSATRGICLAKKIKFLRDATDDDVMRYASHLAEDYRARVVIAYTNGFNMVRLFKQVYLLNASDQFQWIGSDSWSDLDVEAFSAFIPNETISKSIPRVINGAIALIGKININTSFLSYLESRTLPSAKETDPFFEEYLAYFHNCSFEETALNKCPENLTVPKNLTLPVNLQLAANAALAFAHALHHAKIDLCNDSSPCRNFTAMDGSLLRDYLRKVNFTEKNGDVFTFDKFQDGQIHYDIQRFDGKGTLNWATVGVYRRREIEWLEGNITDGRGNVTSSCRDDCNDKDHYKEIVEVKQCCTVCRKCSKADNGIIVTDKLTHVSTCKVCNIRTEYAENDRCLPIPNVFLSFGNWLAWAVAIFCSIGFVLVILTSIVYAFAWSTPLIRASGRELSSLILFGLGLVYLSAFFFFFKPTPFVCVGRRLGTGLSFTLIYAAVLVKTVRISLIFNTLGKKLVRDYKRLLRPMPQVIIALTLTTIEAFIITMWFIQEPPAVKETVIRNNESVKKHVDCAGLTSYDVLIGLAYPILLSILCTVYAVKIRKVPAGFNEAKHIGFAVYTTLAIWLAQLSTYFVNTASDIALRDGINCLGLALNAAVILLALFAPKVYIVCLRPEKNNERMVLTQPSSGYPYSTPPESYLRSEEAENGRNCKMKQLFQSAYINNVDFASRSSTPYLNAKNYTRRRLVKTRSLPDITNEATHVVSQFTTDTRKQDENNTFIQIVIREEENERKEKTVKKSFNHQNSEETDKVNSRKEQNGITEVSSVVERGWTNQSFEDCNISRKDPSSGKFFDVPETCIISNRS